VLRHDTTGPGALAIKETLQRDTRTMIQPSVKHTGEVTRPLLAASPRPFLCSHELGLTGPRLRVAPSAPSSCSGEPSRVVLCDRSTFLLQQFTLAFTVSQDEEYVHLSLVSGRVGLDLGARNHNYLLLVLARRRLRDRRAAASEASCGWVDLEAWSHDPSMRSPRLNIDVFRIRRQFAARGVVDARGIIERRTPTRQIRLGTTQVRIAGE
jgi:hypothetical protein